MEMLNLLIVCSILGFAIGLFTNWIAVASLFRPRNKIFGFQGVLPKRRSEIIERIAEISPLLLPDFKLKVANKIASELFKKNAKKRMNALSDKELEKVIKKAISKELDYIIWLGGILGFIVGLLEAGILNFLG